jgi:hypothetical protein
MNSAETVASVCRRFVRSASAQQSLQSLKLPRASKTKKNETFPVGFLDLGQEAYQENTVRGSSSPKQAV